MTPHVRIRLLLVAAVAILGAATWLDVDAQRAELLDRQAQVVAAADLQTAMVDQETGVDVEPRRDPRRRDGGDEEEADADVERHRRLAHSSAA